MTKHLNLQYKMIYYLVKINMYIDKFVQINYEIFMRCFRLYF